MKKPRILIIEDNEENLALMVFILKHAGFNCKTAMNGELGLQISNANTFDLIICDIQLSGLSGFDFVKEFTKNNMTKQTPIIAVTALSMIGDREKILDSGFAGYISKPIDPTTFAEEILSFLKK